METDKLYELRVLTGLHRGAALPLNGEQWSIGSSSGADLALYDPGIKDRHCMLRLVDETWSLASSEGPVTDSEGHKVEAISQLEPGTPFAVNGVWLSVISANTEWPAEDEEEPPQAAEESEPQSSMLSAERDAQPVKPPRSLLGPMLLIASLLVFVGALMWLLKREEPAPPAPQKPSRVVLKDTTEVKNVLLKMLTERELQKRVTIAEEQGKLFLHGDFDKDDLLQSTSRMLLRFERQYNSPIQVLNALPTATAELPFTIIQISNTRLASILTSDGRRLFLGDEVDGMRFVDINEHKLVFEGERRVEVSW
ncbi:FHA domain-containing protein [Pseudomonas alliivorans]|uniref:Type III secretion protein HrpQ n=1 Tax=Pseudomonas alliivorans TaxID=2810613 RepID=A0ABS4C4C4_9PSED|nr:FHA domain-containing protein [Pseudomonas alliivorans]MBP0945393.1 type III secretion protein HrpQ [Pseudomonas alliivorans]MEE4324156.1 FHA domain-containing protein [Pseudomonas alliivorans]MEE4334587.1 FHA domain-containing protein [Pseudomonas alliivorans]MEE4365686.1 FHA domain-containing protein [Pseudomonas alliivorans]